MRGLDVIGHVAVSLAGVFLALTALVIADRWSRRAERRRHGLPRRRGGSPDR